MMTAVEGTCTICEEAVEEMDSAQCGECDRWFHLNQRTDVDGKDCGDVWIDEHYLSLRFVCFNCLGRQTTTVEPPVGEGH